MNLLWIYNETYQPLTTFGKNSSVDVLRIPKFIWISVTYYHGWASFNPLNANPTKWSNTQTIRRL